MKYLVTGGAGFIGSHLVEQLKIFKHDVIVVDDLSTGSLDNLKSDNIDAIYINKIQNIDDKLLLGIDGIFHLAAQSSVPISIKHLYNSSQNNILGTLKVIEIARKLSIPVIYASSSAVYGNLHIGNDDTNLIDLESPYSVDKYSMEKYAYIAYNLYKLPSIGLRFFNVYGPKQDPSNPYSGVISLFIRQIVNEEVVTVNGGHQTRDFIYVKNVISVLIESMKLLHQKKLSTVINVGTGKSVTINQLLSLIQNITGKSPKVTYKLLPEGDPEVSCGTYDKINKVLKVNINKFTSLENGLKQTINYIKKINEV